MSEQLIHSEQISELVTALAKAQGGITGARKDSTNPFFNSKYADLASCWDACREPLSQNGICVVQTTHKGEPITIKWDVTDTKTGEVTSYSVDSHEIVIRTTMFHASGQWIRSDLALVPRDVTPQGILTCITYGRRGGLCPMVGIAQVDDDGNTASGRDQPLQGKVIKPGVTTTNPRGNAVANADRKKGALYVTEFTKAAAISDEMGVRQLWEELKADQDTSVLVWDDLKKNHGTEYAFISATLKPTKSTGEGRRS